MNEEAENSTTSAFSEIKVLKYQLDNEQYNSERNFFLKADPNDPHSILVSNVPPYIPLDLIKGVFTTVFNLHIMDVSASRPICSQFIDQVYRTISIRLQDEFDVNSMLEKCSSCSTICFSDFDRITGVFGIRKWSKSYCEDYVPLRVLKRNVEKFFKRYDEAKRQEFKRAKLTKNVPDADGWVTVTKSRYKPLLPAMKLGRKDLSAFSRKKKKKDDPAFYHFQFKERKFKQEQEIKRLFELDKKKIAMAKQARKFRPD